MATDILFFFLRDNNGQLIAPVFDFFLYIKICKLINHLTTQIQICSGTEVLN